MGKIKNKLASAALAFLAVNYLPATVSYSAYKNNEDASIKDSIVYGYSFTCATVGICKLKAPSNN